MTRATSLGAYRDVKDFTMPEGVTSVVIDPESLQLATANCPTTRVEVYVAGSAPTQFCELHGGHSLLSSTGSFLSHVFGGQPKTPPTDGTAPPVPYDPNRPPNATGQGPDPADPSAQPEKKKNALHKIFGIFGVRRRTPTRLSRSRRREIRDDQATDGVSSKHPPFRSFDSRRRTVAF